MQNRKKAELIDVLQARIDEPLFKHEQQVGRLTEFLAEKYGLPAPDAERFGNAAELHDIGKFVIPRGILNKPSALTPEELSEIYKHVEHGASMLCSAGEQHESLVVQAALFHHEKFDGSGYPSGKKGYEIPLIARLLAIADVYDALRAIRPYKPRISHSDAVSILTNGDGRTHPAHFDPAVLALLINHEDLIGAHWDSWNEAPLSTATSPLTIGA